MPGGPRRYLLALSNPIIIVLVGRLLANVVVPDGDWVEKFYWAVISVTTIGYGDYFPKTVFGKLLTMVYLPVSVAALAQSLSDISRGTSHSSCGASASDHGASDSDTSDSTVWAIS